MLSAGYEPDVIAGGLQFLRTRHVPYIMLEFSPGHRKEGLDAMLEQLHRLGYHALVIGWDLAKQNSGVDGISMKQFDDPALRADISTPMARKALITSVKINTNLWLSLSDT